MLEAESQCEGKRMVVLAAAAKGRNGAASAMILGDGRGHPMSAWKSSASRLSTEHAALLAIIEGLRQARDRRADRVTVFTPCQSLVARLSHRERVRWSHPMARDWVQARALTHAFTHCEFEAIPQHEARTVIEMAVRTVNPQELAAAA